MLLQLRQLWLRLPLVLLLLLLINSCPCRPSPSRLGMSLCSCPWHPTTSCLRRTGSPAQPLAAAAVQGSHAEGMRLVRADLLLQAAQAGLRVPQSLLNLMAMLSLEDPLLTPA